MKRGPIITGLFGILWLVACTSLANATTLFGLVNTGELFVSADGGVTWTVRSTLPVSDAVAIAAGESSDDLFLATTSGTVYRSADAGATWTPVGTVPANDVVEMPIRPNGDIYLFTNSGVLWRSVDEGAAFTPLAVLTASNHVGLAVGAGGYMYTLTQTGEVSRSADYGSTWATAGIVTTSEAVEIRSVGRDLYVLTASGDVAKSTDFGSSWNFVGTISQVHLSSFTRDGDNLVAATTEGLVAKSTDGVNWAWVGAINQLTVVSLGNDLPCASAVGPAKPPQASAVEFDAPWPNPTSSIDRVIYFRFRLRGTETVTLEMYDIAGRLIAKRAPEVFAAAGEHNIVWTVGELPSGVYLVRLATGSGVHAHRKLAVIR